jgi:zinc/manganese transport system substrate-binding protein
MYKQTLLRTVFALALTATSCAHATTQVFACEPEWAALAKEIGGDKIEATAATTALQDPHYIQARPSLIAGIRNADLIICSGAGLEAGWLPVLLQKGSNPKVQPGQAGSLMASDFVTRLDIPAALDRSQGDLHAQGNPHIQTDPRNIALVANVIAQRLQMIDAPNTLFYQQSLTAFQDKWGKAIARWQQQAAGLRGKLVVPHHKSWAYLNNWLGLVEVATLEAKPGVPPSAAHLEELLQQMQATPAALIIRSPYEDPQASEWLSKRTNIPNAVLPFTVGGLPGTDDLYGLFDTTIRILVESMGGQRG